MDLRIFTEPQQGATYDDLARVALAAESLGFGAFFRSDHYLGMGTDGLPGSTDAWTTLAGLARDTSTIRLGTLMTSATFRLPGPLAITVAQVDQMSDGRAELGIGAGWFEQEHRAYGIPFPSTRERFDRLEESLAVITGLWETPLGERFSYDGRHFPVADSPALPKPVQSPRPPVLVGGKGVRRTPALAARYADEFNLPFMALEETRAQFDRVREACAAIGRDADSLTYSNALVVCCGADDGEVRRRAERIGREPGELRADGLAGTPAEIVDRIGAFAEQGSQRIYLQVLDLDDLDHLELIAPTPSSPRSRQRWGWLGWPNEEVDRPGGGESARTGGGCVWRHVGRLGRRIGEHSPGADREGAGGGSRRSGTRRRAGHR